MVARGFPAALEGFVTKKKEPEAPVVEAPMTFRDYPGDVPASAPAVIASPLPEPEPEPAKPDAKKEN